MLAYYADLARHVPSATRSGFSKVIEGLGILVIVVLFFNREIGQALLNWKGIDPSWAIVAALVLAGYELMRVNYQRVRAIEDDRDEWHDKYDEGFTAQVNKTMSEASRMILKSSIEGLMTELQKVAEDFSPEIVLSVDEAVASTDRVSAQIMEPEELAEYLDNLWSVPLDASKVQCTEILAQRLQRLQRIYSRERKPSMKTHPRRRPTG